MTRLPIEEALPELKAKLAMHNAVVLQAPPGAGKTTMVPLALLDEPWLAGKSILMLEPRRLAARAAAVRMTSLLGEAIGERVGYRIRFESKVGKRTRIEVLTEGILTRRLQQDSALEGVGLVIFDEFHERHLHADLALALCVDCQQGLRDDLRLLVMSATLDGVAVSQLLNNAPIISSEGRSFPVAMRYAIRDAGDRLPETVGEAILRALSSHEGDLLVFLPGAWEIRRTERWLNERLPTNTARVFPLYGDLPWAQQDAAIQPGSRSGYRKIVLATPIAETSLTIEGVTVVIDSGFCRVPQFDPKTGLTGLTTHRISRASSEQRAGRAGRLAPGVCYRLWTETTQRGLVPHASPEIKTADLGPLALELAAWGVADAAKLAWLDPPPIAALSQARDLLRELDALDADGHITDVGHEIVRLPLHPRLAHMLLVAKRLGHGGLACNLAAILTERDILVGEARRSADLTARVQALAAFRAHDRGSAREHGIDANACARAEQAARQWRRLLNVAETDDEPVARPIGVLAALAYPDRVAQQRAKGEGSYLLANGRGARLPEMDVALRAPYLVAASLDAGEQEGKIFLAAPIDEADILQQLAHHVIEQDVVRWDARQEIVVAQREQRLGAIVIAFRPLKHPDPAGITAAMLQGIRSLGLDALPWDPAARSFQARVLFLRAALPEEDWPDVSDANLRATLEQWLAAYLDGITRRGQLVKLDLASILQSQLSWAQQKRLEEGAPTHLQVPSGSSVRLDYETGKPPVLAVKLQEMFGLADTPRVAFGRVPVVLHLLSPARRPIQVTQDLKGFWDRTYAEVRKELKGRYPRHPWPDDPWNAPPTARTRRRGQS